MHDGECRLKLRNGNAFKSFPALTEAIPRELRDQSVMLDGKIVCLGAGLQTNCAGVWILNMHCGLDATRWF